MADFKARYEVNDGYVGGSRPQSFNIPAGWLPENEEATDEYLAELFCDWVDEDMRNRISFHKTNESEFIKWARKQIKARAST